MLLGRTAFQRGNGSRETAPLQDRQQLIATSKDKAFYGTWHSSLELQHDSAIAKDNTAPLGQGTIQTRGSGNMKARTRRLWQHIYTRALSTMTAAVLTLIFFSTTTLVKNEANDARARSKHYQITDLNLSPTCLQNLSLVTAFLLPPNSHPFVPPTSFVSIHSVNIVISSN